MADLTTVAKVKDFLGIVSADNNSTFAVLIKGVSATMERYCGRSFLQASYTEYLDAKPGNTKLFLKNWPITSLTSLKYRTGSWATPTWQAFGASDYLLTEEIGRVNLSVSLPEADKYIQAIYVGGYLIDFTDEDDLTSHTLPFDLTQIATEWVAKIFNTRKATGILSESTEGQSITFREQKVGTEFESRLAPFRNINF